MAWRLIFILVFSSCAGLKKHPSGTFLKGASFEGEESAELLSGSYFLRGNDALKRGEFHLAEELFEKLIKIIPDDPYIETKYAISLIYTKKLTQARNVLIPIFARTYKSGDGQSQKIGLMLAGLHMVLGDNKSANRVYHSVLKKYPGGQEACILLAKSYSGTMKYSKAHKVLKKCENADKNNAVFSYYRGQLYLEQKRRSLAHRYFDRALKVNPEYEKAVIAKGGLWFEEKKFNKTINFYKKYLEKNPYNHIVLSKMVQTMLVLEKEDDIAEYIEKLSYLEPDNLNIKVKLGIIYSNAERYPEAIGIFKEILTVSPDSDKILFYVGSLYKKIRQYNDSIFYFSRISHDSPLFYESALQVASMLELVATDSVEKGEREREQKVDRFISFVNGHGNKFEDIRVDMAMILSGYYEGQSDFTMARNAIVRVRGEKGYNENHEYYLASLHEKAREYKKADEIIQNLLEKNPDNVMALNHFGYTLLERGENLELAYQYIKKAIELQPENGYVRDSLGWYYYKTGNFKAALVEVKKAWETVNTDAVIARHLAQIYVALRKYGLAKKYYRKALKLCQYQWEEKEIRQSLAELKSQKAGANRLPAGN